MTPGVFPGEREAGSGPAVRGGERTAGIWAWSASAPDGRDRILARPPGGCPRTFDPSHRKGKGAVGSFLNALNTLSNEIKRGLEAVTNREEQHAREERNN